MLNNPNHKNYYKKEEVQEVKAPVIEKKEVEEKAEAKLVYPTSYAGLKALTKEEQIVILEQLNVSEKDINKLKLEKQRIKKILELI